MALQQTTGTATNTGMQRQRLALPRSAGLSALASLRHHWPEYLMEAGELALYMFCVCAFATLLQHPASPVRQTVMDALARRALMGLVVGAIVMAIVLSPWGNSLEVISTLR
jgi:hypothetical protein